jgi:hypothetical protein
VSRRVSDAIRKLARARAAVEAAARVIESASSRPARGERSKSEIVSDYRADKEARGECRECRLPAKRRKLRDGTVKILKLCEAHAKADAARKAGEIR